jgi:hypothetical protein
MAAALSWASASVRPLSRDEFAENHDEFPQGEIHLTPDVSLPFVGTVGAPPPVYLVPMPGHPHSEMAVDCADGDAQAGRWPGPVKPSSNAGDWVLLLEFNLYRSGGGAPSSG